MLGGFAGRYGLSKDHAMRLGCAFGGGKARTVRSAAEIVARLV